MSAISNYLTVRASIKKFKEHVKKGSSTTVIYDLLGQILHSVPKMAMTLGTGVQLYRCRIHEKGALFDHVNQLKYAPAERVRSRGRFNEVGESVFYCSNTELGTLVELDPKLELIYAIAVVQQKVGAPAPQIIRFRHANSDDSQQEIPLEKQSPHHRMVNQFLMDELSRPGAEHGYSGTIAIGRHIFTKELVIKGEHGVIPYVGHQRLAITYPSVKAPLYTNVATYNVAMHPNTFDECFEISAVELYSMTFDAKANLLRLTSLNTAMVEADGALTWMYPYEMMLDRTSRGLHGNGVFDESLKDAASYL